MNEELIKILLEKFDKLDNKIDVMIPKQATIEERVNFLIKKVDEQEKRMKENFDFSLDYAKKKVDEHKENCKLQVDEHKANCKEQSDIDMKKVTIIITVISGIVSGLIAGLAKLIEVVK